MSKVFYGLKLISSLSDKSHYTYNEGQIDELFQEFEGRGGYLKKWFKPVCYEFRYSNITP